MEIVAYIVIGLVFSLIVIPAILFYWFYMMTSGVLKAIKDNSKSKSE